MAGKSNGTARQSWHDNRGGRENKHDMQMGGQASRCSSPRAGGQASRRSSPRAGGSWQRRLPPAYGELTDPIQAPLEFNGASTLLKPFYRSLHEHRRVLM